MFRNMFREAIPLMLAASVAPAYGQNADSCKDPIVFGEQCEARLLELAAEVTPQVAQYVLDNTSRLDPDYKGVPVQTVDTTIHRRSFPMERVELFVVDRMPFGVSENDEVALRYKPNGGSFDVYASITGKTKIPEEQEKFTTTLTHIIENIEGGEQQ